ncbi:hypothetical protein RFI_01545 [Reticulomyxa filosa]|uniref:Uncharacterized protein n=1 Tax=Reticulomyxa filosa TaxID=46433 RepID=X6PBG0_RETFI|nr:hypothetical protein RFI_01545 [Reticulomyxa filosa]|eukprot:ETO35516.1 hypothetical protein RFI_01545 [Reticulomyxa filosa]
MQQHFQGWCRITRKRVTLERRAQELWEKKKKAIQRHLFKWWQHLYWYLSLEKELTQQFATKLQLRHLHKRWYDKVLKWKLTANKLAQTQGVNLPTTAIVTYQNLRFNHYVLQSWNTKIKRKMEVFNNNLEFKIAAVEDQRLSDFERACQTLKIEAQDVDHLTTQTLLKSRQAPPPPFFFIVVTAHLKNLIKIMADLSRLFWKRKQLKTYFKKWLTNARQKKLDRFILYTYPNKILCRWQLRHWQQLIDIWSQRECNANQLGNIQKMKRMFGNWKKYRCSQYTLRVMIDTKYKPLALQRRCIRKWKLHKDTRARLSQIISDFQRDRNHKILYTYFYTMRHYYKQCTLHHALLLTCERNKDESLLQTHFQRWRVMLCLNEFLLLYLFNNKSKTFTKSFFQSRLALGAPSVKVFFYFLFSLRRKKKQKKTEPYISNRMAHHSMLQKKKLFERWRVVTMKIEETKDNKMFQLMAVIHHNIRKCKTKTYIYICWHQTSAKPKKRSKRKLHGSFSQPIKANHDALHWTPKLPWMENNQDNVSWKTISPKMSRLDDMTNLDPQRQLHSFSKHSMIKSLSCMDKITNLGGCALDKTFKRLNTFFLFSGYKLFTEYFLLFFFCLELKKNWSERLYKISEEMENNIKISTMPSLYISDPTDIISLSTLHTSERIRLENELQNNPIDLPYSQSSENVRLVNLLHTTEPRNKFPCMEIYYLKTEKEKSQAQDLRSCYEIQISTCEINVSFCRNQYFEHYKLKIFSHYFLNLKMFVQVFFWCKKKDSLKCNYKTFAILLMLYFTIHEM